MADEALERAGQRVLDQALALIRERHESGRIPDHMHYHDSAHTAGVVRRAQAIGRAMDMSDRHLLLTTIAAAYHDVVQRWVPVERMGGIVMRQRLTGRDEVASAHEAVEAMADLGVIFFPDEMGIVASAILATIPGWDGEAGTVSQPFLVAHPVVSAVALADLGAAGMEPETYARDGPALFAEENIDIMGRIMTAERSDAIAADDQERFRSRYIHWLSVQPGFARGRRTRLENGELDGFDPGMKERLLDLFCRFDDSVALAEDAVARAQTLDFVPLMRQLDCRAFPSEAR